MTASGQAPSEAEDLVEKHDEQIKEGIDKLADFLDDKTGHKHADKIDQGAEQAKNLIDKLAGDDKPSKPKPKPTP